MRPALIGALALVLAGCASAPVRPDVAAALAPFQGCWLGAFESSELRDERCVHIEPGRVRDSHVVVGVGYGGDTIYSWNAEASRIDVVYTANDGGRMTGVLTPTADGFVVDDAVYTGADGATQRLRSRWTRNGEGFVTETERLEAGGWRPFMRIQYVAAPR